MVGRNKLVVSVFLPRLSQSIRDSGVVREVTGKYRKHPVPTAHGPLVPVSLLCRGTSAPFSHAQDKNEAAAIFIEGPKLKIGLKHNLKK